ncbi:MAG: hypothetical protein FWG27_00635 [Treponema sp.]|nr:hypothetical protein [Treponema sp.]
MKNSKIVQPLAILALFAVLLTNCSKSSAPIKYFTLGDRIGSVFSSFGSFASGVLVVILGIVVYGIPIVLFCLAAFWLLFGRVGILKKAFGFVMHGNTGSDFVRRKDKKKKKEQDMPENS